MMVSIKHHPDLVGLLPRFFTCPRPEYRYLSGHSSGRSAAWLARPSGGREVESSNLSGPTNIETARLVLHLAGGCVA